MKKSEVKVEVLRKQLLVLQDAEPLFEGSAWTVPEEGAVVRMIPGTYDVVINLDDDGAYADSTIFGENARGFGLTALEPAELRALVERGIARVISGEIPEVKG